MGTEALKAQTKSRDSRVGGGLYKRNGSYYSDFTYRGERVRKPLHTASKAIAQKRLVEMRERLVAGEWGEVEKTTLADAVEPFLRDHVRSLKPKTQEMYGYGLKSVMENLPNKALTSYTKADLLSYENALRDRGLHTQTIINYLRVLSSLMEYAIMRNWLENNPCAGYIKRRGKSGLKKSNPRKRYLSKAEEQRLLRCAAGFDAEARVGRPATKMFTRIVFAIETGLRDDELRSLLWSDLNLQDGYLTVREEVGKSGERRVPITDAARAVLTRALGEEVSGEYVFPALSGGKQDNFDKAWRRVRSAAKLDDVRWHDLRRTCGCRLLERGFAMHEVQRWMGHASVTQTESTYAFLTFDTLKGR